jgi:thioredoxin reductase
VRCDVVVIGAGPAGLAGAVVAAGAGRSVVVVDIGIRPGGQYYRHPEGGSPTRGGRTFARLLVACEARGVRILREQQVFLVDGFTVHTVAGEEITADAVLIATGAHDRVVPFPGWDLPGVLTAGGAQSLLKGSKVLPGKRIVVAGTGPFLLPVAADLTSAGAEVAGVFEANDPRRFARFPVALARNAGKLSEAAGYLSVLARHRVPVRNRHAVVAAHGDDVLTSVTVARVTSDWRPVPGSERTIDCDVLAVGYGFVPQVDVGLALGCASRVTPDGTLALAVDDRQATSVPGVFAAGEVTGIGGARLSLLEGAIAGAALSGVDISVHLRGERARHTAFADAMAAVYPVRDGWIAGLTGDTVLCRCEEVDHDAVRTAVRELGARDARAVKLLTRAGMGWCQGRMCGAAVGCAVADLTGTPMAAADLAAMSRRTLAQPVTLGQLATTTSTTTTEESQ